MIDLHCFCQAKLFGIDSDPEEQVTDNDDSRPNLEYVPNANKNHVSTTATLEVEKGKFAIATLESMSEDQPELKRYVYFDIR